MNSDSLDDSHIAFLLLGGNLNNRVMMLETARKLIDNQIGTIIQASSIYESEPWGFQHQNNFLNQVVKIVTSCTPQQLLKNIHLIEEEMGRKRSGKGYEARTIDIDILFYDDLVLKNTDLIIPHPRLNERMFTLMPLAEIAGDLVHPRFRKTINYLKENCTDRSSVTVFN
jgi:2-amino-4-hydroxy-6-hydroxymethyldihydropteridine diphosphokinase